MWSGRSQHPRLERAFSSSVFWVANEGQIALSVQLLDVVPYKTSPTNDLSNLKTGSQQCTANTDDSGYKGGEMNVLLTLKIPYASTA